MAVLHSIVAAVMAVFVTFLTFAQKPANYSPGEFTILVFVVALMITTSGGIAAILFKLDELKESVSQKESVKN